MSQMLAEVPPPAPPYPVYLSGFVNKFTYNVSVKQYNKFYVNNY